MLFKFRCNSLFPTSRDVEAHFDGPEARITLRFPLEKAPKIGQTYDVEITGTGLEPSAPTAPRTDGPTLEEFVAAGYKPENYPPSGYAERPSAGLDEYRAAQQKSAEQKH